MAHNRHASAQPTDVLPYQIFQPPSYSFTRFQTPTRPKKQDRNDKAIFRGRLAANLKQARESSGYGHEVFVFTKLFSTCNNFLALEPRGKTDYANAPPNHRERIASARVADSSRAIEFVLTWPLTIYISAQ